MYTPTHFAESRLPVLHGLIRGQPFATLVANTGKGLNAEHIPLILDGSRGEFGVLHGHVARANTVWRELQDGAEVLAIFQGSQHYISPNWYPTKFEHGKVVPTWNYIVVQARGTITWIDEPAWLRAFLERLTDSQEVGRPEPWKVSDAPDAYVDRNLKAIVGLEIQVTAMSGKWKLSQNREARDRAGVVAGLRAEPGAAAAEMAKQMEES